ncbi:hypothetical protein DPSP01_012350 [Paraphaeosphaeria sporulosa]
MFQNRRAGVGFDAGRYLVDAQERHPRPWQQRPPAIKPGKDHAAAASGRVASTRATKLCPGRPTHRHAATATLKASSGHSIPRWFRGVEPRPQRTLAGGFPADGVAGRQSAL